MHKRTGIFLICLLMDSNKNPCILWMRERLSFLKFRPGEKISLLENTSPLALGLLTISLNMRTRGGARLRAQERSGRAAFTLQFWCWDSLSSSLTQFENIRSFNIQAPLLLFELQARIRRRGRKERWEIICFVLFFKKRRKTYKFGQQLLFVKLNRRQ